MDVTTAHPTDEIKGMACRVSVATVGGREYTKEVKLAKGEPENPPTWDETVAKFTSLARESLGDGSAEQVVDAIRELDRFEDLSEFTKLLRP